MSSWEKRREDIDMELREIGEERGGRWS